ncbi:hypothetical protein ACI4B7_26790, partial [Klebsiella pneumoniae]|uniref:hypothetical protein n=1 Tax=Klebsiella pneumoniae TaxID=573 RepID=UPI0038543BB4
MTIRDLIPKWSLLPLLAEADRPQACTPFAGRLNMRRPTRVFPVAVRAAVAPMTGPMLAAALAAMV